MSLETLSQKTRYVVMLEARVLGTSFLISIFLTPHQTKYGKYSGSRPLQTFRLNTKRKQRVQLACTTRAVLSGSLDH